MVLTEQILQIYITRRLRKALWGFLTVYTPLPALGFHTTHLKPVKNYGFGASCQERGCGRALLLADQFKYPITRRGRTAFSGHNAPHPKAMRLNSNIWTEAYHNREQYEGREISIK